MLGRLLSTVQSRYSSFHVDEHGVIGEQVNKEVMTISNGEFLSRNRPFSGAQNKQPAD
jgi:hypothetical protein